MQGLLGHLCKPGIETGLIHGLETVISYEQAGQTGLSIKLGMIFAGILLLILSLRTLKPDSVLRPLNEDDYLPIVQQPQPQNVNAHPPPAGQGALPPAVPAPPAYHVAQQMAQAEGNRMVFRPSILRYIIAGYAAGTAFFAFSRVIWDTSRILLVLAAVHNMAEWMLLSFLFFKDEVLLAPGEARRGWTAQKGMVVSFVWIWLVITVTVLMPFHNAVLFEQTSGIMCDFMLGKAFYDLFTQETVDTKRRIWMFGLIAALSHFGQIFPLVIGTWGFRGGVGMAMEWSLIFSSGITFFSYSQFVIEWESQYFKYLRDVLQQNHNVMSRTPGLTRNRTSEFWWTFCFGSVCGVVTIIGGRLVPDCAPSNVDTCPVRPMPVTGYTLLTAKPGQGRALRQALTPMLPKVREEPGCISYDLYELQDEKSHDSLLFFETWKDEEALKMHVATSSAVQSIFRSQYVNAMIADKQMKGLWLSTDPEELPVKGEIAVSFNVTEPMDRVWKVLNNWDDYSWFQGCTHQEKFTPDRRVLFFGPNAGLEVDRLNFNYSKDGAVLEYEVNNMPGYKEYVVTIRLVPLKSGGTTATFMGSIVSADPKQVLNKMADRRQEIEARVPFLQHRFSKFYRSE